jgi:hypothetical protein
MRRTTAKQVRKRMASARAGTERATLSSSLKARRFDNPDELVGLLAEHALDDEHWGCLFERFREQLNQQQQDDVVCALLQARGIRHAQIVARVSQVALAGMNSKDAPWELAGWRARSPGRMWDWSSSDRPELALQLDRIAWEVRGLNACSAKDAARLEEALASGLFGPLSYLHGRPKLTLDSLVFLRDSWGTEKLLKRWGPHAISPTLVEVAAQTALATKSTTFLAALVAIARGAGEAGIEIVERGARGRPGAERLVASLRTELEASRIAPPLTPKELAAASQAPPKRSNKKAATKKGPRGGL